MDELLLAVVLVLLVLMLFIHYGYENFQSFTDGKVQPVDMISFRSEDPIKTKFTQRDRDGWGLDNSDKYYENLVYYNQGLSEFDPAGPGMFDVVTEPLPGMSEIDRLGYEVLGDQAKSAFPGEFKMSFAPPMMEDSQIENVG